MAATMSTTAAPPASRFTPGPACLESIFLAEAERDYGGSRGCLPTTNFACPIYHLGLTAGGYYRDDSSSSCYPNPGEAVQGCPVGYTTACATSTVTTPVFNTKASTLDWPVTNVDAVCCPTNMQFECIRAGYYSTSCIAPITQDTVIGLHTHAAMASGKPTLTEAATLRADQDFIWASGIGVGERVYGSSVVYVDYGDPWGPALDRRPRPAVQTQQHWAPGGNARRTGIAALCAVLAVTVLFFSSVFGFWRKRRTLQQRRAKRDIYSGNWTRAPPGASDSVRSRTRLTDGAPASGPDT